MESAFSKDNWHRQAASIAIRNSIRSRRWGMRVTVYTGGSAGDYVLSYGLVDTNLQNNANWLKVADIGETWGGGGGASTPENEYFTGDGVEDEFTIADAAGLIQYVEVGGQVMRPGTDYNVAGPVVTFTTPPGNGIDIGVYYWNAVVVGAGVQSVTGTGVNNADPENPIINLPNGLAAVDVSGTVIAFVVPQIYGTDGSPETGNITIDTTGLVKGMVQLLIHNDSSEPTYGSEIKLIGGEYEINVNNYIFLLAVSATLVLATISQEL